MTVVRHCSGFVDSHLLILQIPTLFELPAFAAL
jgi:hypothetical protein